VSSVLFSRSAIVDFSGQGFAPVEVACFVWIGQDQDGVKAIAVWFHAAGAAVMQSA